MKRILIPVDGSDAALRAAKAAIEATLQHTVRPDVRLVSVQAPILSGNVTRFFTADMIESYYQEEGEKALVSARQALDEAGIDYQEAMLHRPLSSTPKTRTAIIYTWERAAWVQ